MTDITKVPEGYTEEEWADLSDTEKEGIVDSIEEPEGKEELSEDELKKIVGGPEDKKEGEPQKPEEQVKGNPPADQPENPTDNPPEKPPENPPEKQGEVPDDDILLKYRANVTEEELKLEEQTPPELKAKLDDLKAKYDEGELSIHDYTDQRDAINRQIYRHNSALEAAAREEAVWKKEQLYFLKHRPEYLPGQQADAAGKVRANALFGALSEMVKSLSQDDANSGLSGMQLLVKADGIVKEAFGLKKVAKAPEKPSEQKPAAPLPDHKTLSDIPAAGRNDTMDDAFAQLDKLSGEAYETALERLSPEQRDAYLGRV